MAKKILAVEKRLKKAETAVRPFRIRVNEFVRVPFTFRDIPGANGQAVVVETFRSRSNYHYSSGRANAYVFTVKDLYEICSYAPLRSEFEAALLRLDGMCDWVGIFVETDRASLYTPPKNATVTPDTVDRWSATLTVRYRCVPWVWCSGRRDCEVAVYRHLHAACGTDTDTQVVRRAMAAYQTGWKSYLIGLPARSCPGPATQEGAWWAEGYFDAEESYRRVLSR